MTTLISIQNKFLNSLKGVESFENLIRVNGPSPMNRLSVYHNNIVQSLINTLSIAYPLVWELVGEECARGAAFRYVERGKSLPTSGDIYSWGATFPDFLETYQPTQDLAYLPDFARLEWLMHLAYGEEEKPSLTSDDFKGIEPEQFDKLILKLHPSAYLLSSPHALDQVMAVLKEEVETITLENRRSYALILRPQNAVKVHWISESYFSFFSHIQNGDSLLESFEKIHDEGFPFAEFLSFSLKNGVFSEYRFLTK